MRRQHAESYTASRIGCACSTTITMTPLPCRAPGYLTPARSAQHFPLRVCINLTRDGGAANQTGYVKQLNQQRSVIS